MTAEEGRPFLFVLHCHQPAGNLPAVMQQAYARCYRPLLETLARFEAVKVTLHVSGALLEHAALEEPSFIAALRDRVAAGQVELLGGGFYEPVLSALPDADALGQLRMMRLCLDKHFGVRPNGAWLAERVFEPDLPRILAASGARFTFLDAHHVQAALPDRGVADGYFVTEKAGRLLAVFPVDRGLRDRVPGAEPEAVVEYIAGAPGSGALTFADDGEKLGLWPGSYPWVHEAGWLARFFGALEQAQAAGRVRTTLPTRHLETAPPRGRVYIPGGAYPELGRWALSPQARLRYERVEAAVGPDELDRAHLRGGTWRDFLVRYPEAGWLHGRMLSISERLAQALEGAAAGGRPMPSALQDRLGSAQRELYRAQGADAYWRGWFGGIHLPFLRADAHRALVRAEALLDRVQQGEDPFVLFEERDLDLDGELEITLANAAVAVHVSPHDGGVVRGLDDKVRGLQLVDVLARWPGDGEGEAVDDRARAAFVDRFLAPGEALDGPDLGDFAAGRYRVVELAVDEEGEVQARLQLARDGEVAGAAVTVHKSYRLELDGAHLAVEYRIQNRAAAPLVATFAPELSLALSAGARIRVDGAEGWAPLAGAAAVAGEAVIEDPQDGLRLVVDLSRAVRLGVEEVFTEIETPAGRERIRQGLQLRLGLGLELGPGEEAALTLGVYLREAPR